MRSNQKFLLGGMLALLGVLLLSLVLIIASATFAPPTSTGAHATSKMAATATAQRAATATPVPPARHIIFSTSKQNLDNLNAADGSLAWSHAFPVASNYSWSALPKGEVTLADGILFHVTITDDIQPNTILTAVTASNGQVLWTFNEGDFSVGPGAIHNGVVYVVGQPPADQQTGIATLYALNEQSGQVLWQVHDANFVGMNGDLIFASTNTHQTVVLHAADGSVAWRSNLHLMYTGSGANQIPLDPNLVFLQDSTGTTITALNVQTGATVWQWQPQLPSGYGGVGLRAITAQAVIFYAYPGYQSTQFTRAYVLNKATGMVQTYYTDGQNGKVVASDLITSGDGRIGYGFAGNNTTSTVIDAVDMTTGIRLWSVPCAPYCLGIWGDQQALYTHINGGLMAVRQSDGHVLWQAALWKTSIDQQYATIGCLTAANNIISFGVYFYAAGQTSLADTVYTLDSATGHLEWTHPISGSIMTDPIILP